MALPVNVPTARFTLRIAVANRYGVVRVAARHRVVEERPVEGAVETVFLFHALVALIRSDGDQQRREIEVAVLVVVVVASPASSRRRSPPPECAPPAARGTRGPLGR